jgi:ABC-2 type transport system permease protein
MKGLLIKDLKLMKGQKNFFLIIAAVVIGMMLFSDDIVFPLGFLTFIVSLFTLSTVSYDEFDNGYPFLFSLPITRPTYIIEKYCLGLILGLGAWTVSGILAVITGMLKGTASLHDILICALIILILMFLIQAVMLPFQIKFGGEKGRVAIIASIGLLFVIGVVVVKAAEALNIDPAGIIRHLPVPGVGAVAALAATAAVILWLISMKISISIMNRKEF